MSVICEPIWLWIPINFTFFISFNLSSTPPNWLRLIPNLFSFIPVVILACVWASTSGLIRRAIEATLFLVAASSLMISSSTADSTLKQKISLSSPRLISQSALPTPAKTILSAGKPASKAACTSPPLTQSAPRPFAAMMERIRGLAFAFTA